MLAISRTHMFSPYKNIPLDSEEYDICESKIQARFRSNVLQLFLQDSSHIHSNIIGTRTVKSLNFLDFVLNDLFPFCISSFILCNFI